MAGWDYTGGIAGMASNCHIMACNNHAEIHAGQVAIEYQSGGICGHWRPETKDMHLCANEGLLVGSGAESFFFGELAGFLELPDAELPCIFDCCTYSNTHLIGNGVGNEHLPIFGECVLGH